MGKVRKQVKEKLAALITAAFGLVAALAWNDTIRGFFELWYGKPNNPYAMIVYAILVTIIAVIATIWIGKIVGEEEEKK